MRRSNWLFLLCLTATIGACGEDSLNPARRVAAVAISRDHVSLEVGDTVALRAEPRDVNGDPVLEAGVTWSSRNPTVAGVTSGASGGRVFATGPGTARIVAQTGFVAETALVLVPPPFTATVLAQHLDTLTSVGDFHDLDIVSTSAAGPRPGVYTATTSSYAVASAELAFGSPGTLRIVATGAGSTVIRVTERHGTADSLQVLVVQVPNSVSVGYTPISGYAGRTRQLSPSVMDRRGYPIPGAPVSYAVVDTTVATVSPLGLLSFMSAGRTEVVVAGPAGLADTEPVTTFPMPRLVLQFDSLVTATGLLSTTQLVGFDVNEGALSPYVHLTVLDTTIASAPDSVLGGSVDGSFQVTGRNPGTTLLIASTPLLVSDTTRIRVTSPTLRITDVDYGVDHEPPLTLSSPAGVTVTLVDSLGEVHAAADSVPISVASTDTILSLPQNAAPYPLSPPASTTPSFPVVTVDTGTSWIVTTAPGFRPDSLLYHVTVLPALRFQEGPRRLIGAGQTLLPYAEKSTITTTQGPIHGAVSVTFTRLHPAVDSFPDSVTIQAGAIGAPARFAGLTAGTDTVLASAPGYLPDTLVLVVTTPHFVLPDSVSLTVVAPGVLIAVADALGDIHGSTSPLDVIATPADSTVARESGTAIPAGWESPFSLQLTLVDSGATPVTVTDLGGLYAPKVIALRVRLDDRLVVADIDPYNHGPSAPGQRFDLERISVSAPVPQGTAVHLTSTDPRVVRVPDSVLSGYNGSIQVPAVAGDTTGTARIIATLPGFLPDTTVPVPVAPGHLHLNAFSSATVGATYIGQVIVQNARNIGLPLDSAATFSLIHLDNGIGGATSVTVAAGQAVSNDFALTFAAPGTYHVAVVDNRGTAVPYSGDTVIITAAVPRLFFFAPPNSIVAPNQLLDGFVSRAQDVPANNIVVRVSRHGSHTASADSIVLGAGVYFTDYPVTGHTIGLDTLVFAAAGYQVDTAIIVVSEGRAGVTLWPSALPASDSVLLYLQITDSTGRAHSSAGPTVFAILADGGVTFSDGTKQITSLTVAASDNFVPFFMRATGPVGTARVRFYNLYYSDQTYQLTVTP